MQRRPENFKAAGADPDETLVTPRFDADEERRAHPVVPLAQATPPRASRGMARGPRRSWTNALLGVALLAVAAIAGAVATNVMRGSGTKQVQEQTQSAPAQAAKVPPEAVTPAAAPREESPAAQPAPRDPRPRRARTAALAAARDDAEDYGDDDERRGKAEKRREREDHIDKEMRKAIKRAKGKAPRLVDVLTGP